MKKYIQLFAQIIICLVFIGCASMQVVPHEERSLQFVHHMGVEKDYLFTKSLEWMAQVFVDSREVIHYKDKESGKIIGKGRISFLNYGIALIPCKFTITIDIKDNKYRTTYDSFTGMWGEFHNQPMPVVCRDHIDQVRNKLTAFDKSLSEYLLCGASDNW